MAGLRSGWPGGLVLLAGAALSAAPPASTRPAGTDPDRKVRALAARMDHHLEAGWAAGAVQPAPLADDAEFVRRVSLDLAGRIPSVSEVRAFLEDTRPDKRLRLVDRLLEGPRYVTHFTQVWRALLLPEANTNFQARYLTPGFEAWLRRKLSANAPYDQMVRDLLTSPVGPAVQGNPYAVAGRGTTPIGFYLAKELKPENVAAATARLFLGVKLECAQCHNHPFADWKREQFWGLAAFFAGMQRQGNGDFVAAAPEKADRRELTIPGTERVVRAAFLDGTMPKWKTRQTPRETLAEWMTRADNPYFARAAVNRMWAYFLGTGLVEPVDEMVGGEHRSHHPELLDELAHAFTAHGFDLKFLIRAITASRAYQLTSRGREPVEAHLFARMPLRGLSAEQLYDSVAQATGFREPAVVGPPGAVVFNNRSSRNDFLNRFANETDRPTEVQTSILQALALMNGRLIADATSLEKSETLAAVVDAPFLDMAGRIETLFLATLSRPPREREKARILNYLAQASAGVEPGSPRTPADQEKASQQALANVFWVLLNSAEFYLNH